MGFGGGGGGGGEGSTITISGLCLISNGFNYGSSTLLSVVSSDTIYVTGTGSRYTGTSTSTIFSTSTGTYMYSTSCVTAAMFGLARGPDPIYFCLTEVPSEADLTGADLLLEDAEETIGPDV